MNTAQPLGCGFIVYDFFSKELNLTPVEQLIFGIILSFTKDGGDFNGSRSYLAQRVNVTERTVSTTLSSLLKKKLILKFKSPSAHSRALYRVNFKIISSASQNEKIAGGKKCTDRAKKSQSEGEKISDNNKEINKPIIKNNNNHNKNALTRGNSPSGVFEDRKERGKAETEVRDPENEIFYIGKDRIVNMTYRQYNTLSCLVGEEILEDYLARAEFYATEGIKQGKHVFSFYNAIRKWLREDYGV